MLFKRFKKILVKKKRNFHYYENIFKEQKNFSLLKPSKKSVSNHWLNTLILENENIDKNIFIKTLHKYNIKARPIWKPLHTLKHLKKYPKMSLEITNKIYKKTISIPSGPDVLAGNVEFLTNQKFKF